MPSRPDNLAVACFAEGPGLSQPAPAASTMISDHEWVAQRYFNFRAFVGSLVAQEPALASWVTWLDELPLRVFLAGGDHELKGVRGAATDDKRAEEAGLVLERWALQYDFDLERIFETDRDKLRRYILLFSVA